MSRTGLLLILLLTVGAIGGFALAVQPVSQSQLASAAPPRRPVIATEQQWIVVDVVGAIARIAQPPTPSSPQTTSSLVEVTSVSDTAFTVKVPGLDQPVSFTVVDHLWTPATFEPVARQVLSRGATGATASGEPEDLNVRGALVDLTIGTLLDQNDRLSSILQRDVRSADAHESAALLVGAFALREGTSVFSDVRPSLSRMAAHLAIAKVLRGSSPESADARYAHAVLTTLVGLQRKALVLLSALETRAASDTDRAWIRALRLRNTGDWRRVGGGVTDNTRLERMEHARAVRARLGSEALLSYLDGQSDGDEADWHRAAFTNEFSLEAAARFGAQGLDGEVSEASDVWRRLHGDREIAPADLIAALNERSAQTVAEQGERRVLDWSMWAAFYQRHICQSLVETISYFWYRGDEAGERSAKRELGRMFGTLTLYPVVERWTVRNAKDYEDAMAHARPMVQSAPYLITAAAWDQLLQKPSFTARTEAFPLEASWFTPAVPSGTAFDLGSRSLRPGCPRPPTREQARTWAIEQPYEHWTVWAEAYLALDQGRPSYGVVRKAFGPLLEYDVVALLKVTDYLQLTAEERTAIDERLCQLSPDQCDKLAAWHLLGDRERDAVAAYERWIRNARDRVMLSNGLTWISRYYLDAGRQERAEVITQEAADTYSRAGLQVHAELLEKSGRESEAEELYRRIGDRYTTVPLGGFLMKKALRTKDAALEAKAGELLRPVFPDGPQRVVMYALPAGAPPDGITFAQYGPRPAKTGLQPRDVIIGVDEWRVHNPEQYAAASRFRAGETMIFTVWRDNRYQQVKATVPQRWLGVTFNHHVNNAARQ